MEHIYENQQPNEIDAYEDCIRVIAKSFQNPNETAEQIRLFGTDPSKITLEDREYIGLLMNGVVAASPEIFDIDSPQLAARTFIHGAMTGLYVGNTMLGETMSAKDVLATSKSVIEYGARNFYHEIEKLTEQMHPEIKRILNSWMTSLGSEEAHKQFFDLGFGVTMASVNKTIYEMDLFRDLENMTDWNQLDSEATSDIKTVSVDDDCLMLAQAFQDRATEINFDQLPLHKRQAALQHIAKLLIGDISHTKELKPFDVVQTRGMGICIGYDENDKPDGVYKYNELVKIRGRIARIDCMSVPTEFAVLMGAEYEEYEPQLCLVLENVEMVEQEGNVDSHDGRAAIPLRISGSTQLDKIVNTETDSL